MSATWQIENTYYKIGVDNSANPELFNIASCENYMVYWDLTEPTSYWETIESISIASLYIYNIPNDVTQISSYKKEFRTANVTQEFILDVNKNGVCFYLIDNTIGLFGVNGHDISLSSDEYDCSNNRLAI